jgi:hypothetical protein
MGDLGAAFGELLEGAGPVVGSALKALLRTAVGTVVLGMAVLGLEAWLVVHRPLQAAVLLGPGLALLVAMTGVLVVKNTVLQGVLEAVRRVGLGERMVRLVFSKLEGGSVDRSAQRLPLREAEQKVRAVVDGLLAERAAKPGMRAWVARRLSSAVMERVQTITLARLREDDAAHGGVELTRVGVELAGVVDGLIAKQVGDQLNRLNVLVFAGYVVVTAVLSVLVARLS